MPQPLDHRHHRLALRCAARSCTDVTDPSAVFAVQTWTSADAFRVHMDAAGGFGPLTDLLTEAPRVSILTVAGH